MFFQELFQRLRGWIWQGLFAFLHRLRALPFVRTSKPYISGIYIYPIKSCAGIRVESALLWQTGLELDRVWMIVKGDTWEFMTQRKNPKMALIRTRLVVAEEYEAAPSRTAAMGPQYQRGGYLELFAIGHSTTIRVPFRASFQDIPDDKSMSIQTKIWNHEVWVLDEGDTVSQWLSTVLKVPNVRLVLKDPRKIRPVNQARVPELLKTESDALLVQTACADGYPLLILSEASVADVNRRLQERLRKRVLPWKMDPLEVRRFRPNLVIGGCAWPYEEDQWKVLRTQKEQHDEVGVELHCVKLCTRCTLPNNDPETGVPSELGEPLKTLMSYRRIDPTHPYEACLGVNALYHLATQQGRKLTQGERFMTAFT